MKRFIKKLMSLSLVLLLCIGLLPAAAAEEADYTFTLASPDSVTVDYRKEYTTFGVELSSMPPADESAGQSFVLVFTEGSMTDGTNTVPYDVLTVMEYGNPWEWLVGGGVYGCEAVFRDLSDISYCAIRIPEGEYEPGTYTGMLEYVSRYYYPDFYDYTEMGPFYIPISVTIPEQYTVTVGEVQHGIVSADCSEAYAGDTVVLTADPESEYYELSSISATCGGTPVALTQSAEHDNQYSFVMPEGPVTVSAVFRSKGICEIRVFERVWDGMDITGTFTKDAEGLYRYDLRVDGEEFDDEYSLLPYKLYDVGILIDGSPFTEDDPVNMRTQNYYYIFDSTENLHLVEGDGYDGASDSRPMILIASQKGVYHFTLNADTKTLTVTHTYDDPDAEAYAYVLGFQWMDEIPHPMGDAHTVAGTENAFGMGAPIDEEDIYDFEGEETVWLTTDVPGGDFTDRFRIGREGKVYGSKTLIHDVGPDGLLRELGSNGEDCRITPDFGEAYRGIYDLFYGIDSHKLMVFRRSVELIYSFDCPHYEVYGNVRPTRGTSGDGITIDREGTIYSGDEVTLSTAAYRDNGRLRFAGWYNAEGFEWDEESGEPYGDCVSEDNVYTFGPYDDTSLLAVYTYTPFDDGYYLIGPDWSVDAIDKSERFAENPDAEGEYVLSTTLAAGGEIKVVRVEDGAITGWYPDGIGNQYYTDAAYAGDVRIYFRPAYNSDWAAFGGYIWIVREYAVTAEKPAHGHVESETKRAAAGETVTLNVYGSGGYVLDTLTVLCGDAEVETIGVDEWTYTFVMPAGDVTVTAVFKGEPYTATFVPDYEDETGRVEQQTEYRALLTPPEDPVREGYVFGGWYEPDWNRNWWYDDEVGYRTEDFTLAELLADWKGYDGDRYMRAWDFEEDTVSFDVTLYAKWTKAPAAPAFKTQALTLEGQIGVNFYLDLSALSEEEKAASYMTFDISGAGTVSSDPVPFDANKTNPAGTYHGFSCYVNSIQMADTITATFHYGDNQTIEKQYSVKQYIETFDANQNLFDEYTKTLVKALADYGHYVQAFLSESRGWTLGEGDNSYAEMDRFYQNDYDYATIAESLTEKKLTREFNDPNIVKAPYSVILESATTIAVYFTPAAGFNGDVSASVDMNDEAALTRQPDGRYRVEIANIPAHELGEDHSIYVYTGENCFNTDVDAYTTVNVSAMSYVYSILTADAYANNTAAKNAVSSLYAYWQAAAAYKDAQNN